MNEMEAAISLDEKFIVAELEKVKERIRETNDLIQTLTLERRKLEKTYDDLKLKHNKCLEAKLYEKDWEGTDYEWSAKIQSTLESIFKMKKFRPFQLAAINAVMCGQDCLLLMPTGGGKSLCYQLPAKVLKGITLVVSPLVSLMEDQVMALQELNYPATMLSASVPLKESRAVMKSMIEGNCPFKLLYVTPEKLSKSKTFISSLQKTYERGNFSLLAIDEVHCCSQWGHDFRPDYKILGIMKRQFPSVPILGVTATATPEIFADVKDFLALEGCLTFKVPFDRPNLKYKVHLKPSNKEETINKLVALLKGKFNKLSGIIYCFSVKDSDQVATDLQKHGIKALSYHAQLNSDQRSRAHKYWAANKVQVVVATVAFGMGIDKPDVRFVIHHSIAKSMESYYQESGRAGRDDGVSECILFYHMSDVFRLSAMVNEDRKALKKLYQMVDYCLDLSRCRRAIIAQYFDEKWNKKECNKMCDHCMLNSTQVNEVDLNEQCFYIFDIIRHCESIKQRITALKLINICIEKCPSNLKPRKVNIRRILRQETYERLLALMLVKGFVKESFSFTAYATISYIEIGDQYRDKSRSSFKFCLFSMPTPGKRQKDDSLECDNEVAPVKKPTPGKRHKHGSPELDNEVIAVQEPTPSASNKVQHNSKRRRIIDSDESDDCINNEETPSKSADSNIPTVYLTDSD